MKKNIGFYGISEVKQICHVKMKKKKKKKNRQLVSTSAGSLYASRTNKGSDYNLLIDYRDICRIYVKS